MTQAGQNATMLIGLRKEVGGDTLTNQEMLVLEQDAARFLTRNGYPFPDEILFTLVFRNRSDNSYYGAAVTLPTDPTLRQLIESKAVNQSKHWWYNVVEGDVLAWIDQKADQLDLDVSRR